MLNKLEKRKTFHKGHLIPIYCIQKRWRYNYYYRILWKFMASSIIHL